MAASDTVHVRGMDHHLMAFFMPSMSAILAPDTSSRTRDQQRQDQHPLNHRSLLFGPRMLKAILRLKVRSGRIYAFAGKRRHGLTAAVERRLSVTPAHKGSKSIRRGRPQSDSRRMRMNKERLEGKWAQFLGQIQAKWGKVTHNDVVQIAGRREQIHGQFRELYGISKEAAEKELATLNKDAN
jgi:uncharacterized protein YjbJ (UPF0337 family)